MALAVEAGGMSALDSIGRLGTLATEDRLAALHAERKPVLQLRGAASRALPPHVRQAVVEVLDTPGARPPSRGLPELREAVARSVEGDCGATVDPATEVLVTHGAMHALNVCFRALCGRGDRVVVPSPAFFFGGPIRLAGAEPVYVPGAEGEGWRWDPEALEAAIDARTKAIVLCNPVNPTGYLPTPGDMAAMVELAERHDLLIVADESYERYVYDGAQIASALSVDAAKRRTVLIRSMSKSFAMGDWRVGYVVAEKRLIDRCARALEWDCVRGSPVAQRAAAAAIEGPRDWLAGIVAEYERNRELAYAAVACTGTLSCVKPAACPFLFVNLSRVKGLGGGSPEDDLAAAGIPAVPGRYFQAPGYVRLPFGGEPSTLEALGPLLERWATGPRRSHAKGAGLRR